MKARVGGLVFRTLLAAGLTTYLFWRSNPSAVLQSAAAADVSWILLAVALVLIDRALMAHRWVTLLCIVDKRVRPPLRRLIAIFFVSTFVGTFLPASIGGDAVRAYRLSRDHVSGADAVASVLMDRILGVASLLLMTVLGLFLARDLAGHAVVLAALALTAGVCLLTLLFIVSDRVGAWGVRLVGALPVVMLQRTGQQLIASVRRYARFHAQLVYVLASSVAVQVLRIAQAYCLGRALGIEAPLVAYVAFIPMILLIMLLPVTINGLGTSQAAFVWFFARAGVHSAPAFALSILFVGLGIVGNLPGALLYAVQGGPLKSAASR